MNHKEIIPKYFYEIKVPDFNTRLFISLEQSYDELKKFLINEGINESEVKSYIEYGFKDKHIQGRTTLLIEENIIIIKMNYFDNNINRISILNHEIIHAAKKIVYMYEYYKEKELEEREEAICYISEFIFEEIMLLLQPKIEYQRVPRNFQWFYEITHKLKQEPSI